MKRKSKKIQKGGGVNLEIILAEGLCVVVPKLSKKAADALKSVKTTVGNTKTHIELSLYDHPMSSMEEITWMFFRVGKNKLGQCWDRHPPGYINGEPYDETHHFNAMYKYPEACLRVGGKSTTDKKGGCCECTFFSKSSKKDLDTMCDRYLKKFTKDNKDLPKKTKDTLKKNLKVVFSDPEAVIAGEFLVSQYS